MTTTAKLLRSLEMVNAFGHMASGAFRSEANKILEENGLVRLPMTTAGKGEFSQNLEELQRRATQELEHSRRPTPRTSAIPRRGAFHHYNVDDVLEECRNLERDLEASRRILTRCPVCQNQTLTINEGHLLCTWHACADPTLIDRDELTSCQDAQAEAKRAWDAYNEILEDHREAEEAAQIAWDRSADASEELRSARLSAETYKAAAESYRRDIFTAGAALAAKEEHCRVWRERAQAAEAKIDERTQIAVDCLRWVRRAWEAGFDLARSYGDNWAHWQGEQRERTWQKFLEGSDIEVVPAAEFTIAKERKP